MWHLRAFNLLTPSDATTNLVLLLCFVSLWNGPRAIVQREILRGWEGLGSCGRCPRCFLDHGDALSHGQSLVLRSIQCIRQIHISSGNLSHSYWNLPFIADLSIKNGGYFHSLLYVYQRVNSDAWYIHGISLIGISWYVHGISPVSGTINHELIQKKGYPKVADS